MASHVDLLTELQLLEKVPTLERLRAARPQGSSHGDRP